MTNIYVVRHGAVNNPLEADPVLSVAGQQQALQSAQQLMQLTAPIAIISSPLQRCQQSAKLLANAWQTQMTIDQRVREVPSPMSEPHVRSIWLHQMLHNTWTQMRNSGDHHTAGYGKVLSDWQSGLQTLIKECQQDVVIYSHFFIINALLGMANRQGCIMQAMPDHGAVFQFKKAVDALTLVKSGLEMPSLII